jgi:hypothetical protein
MTLDNAVDSAASIYMDTIILPASRRRGGGNP